jgi:hypothetical protein
LIECVCVCVCVCARAYVRVCVCVRARARAREVNAARCCVCVLGGGVSMLPNTGGSGSSRKALVQAATEVAASCMCEVGSCMYKE